MTAILFTFRVFIRRQSSQNIVSNFVLIWPWGLNCGLTSSKASHYELDYLFILNINTARNRKTNKLLVILTFKTKTSDSERNK